MTEEEEDLLVLRLLRRVPTQEVLGQSYKVVKDEEHQFFNDLIKKHKPNITIMNETEFNQMVNLEKVLHKLDIDQMDFVDAIRQVLKITKYDKEI